MLMLKIRAYAAKAGRKFRKFFTGESGEVNIIAMVLLIAIAVLLAVFFRKQIVDLAKRLFNGINDDIGNAVAPVE